MTPAEGDLLDESALWPNHLTEADTLDALHEQVRDAVRCHFEEAERPKVIAQPFESRWGRCANLGERSALGERRSRRDGRAVKARVAPLPGLSSSC